MTVDVTTKVSYGTCGGVAIQAHVIRQNDGVTTTSTVIFTGSSYGTPGPVHMQTGTPSLNCYVEQPGRFGDKFDVAWVEKFFAAPTDQKTTV